MHIDVIASVGEARSDDLIHKTVIVIDVLRATSTLITALANGCGAVIPVETVAQAREIQKSGDLLGGERYCKKIPGFDYGNSPMEMQTKDIIGKRLIMTTTNGTRGIQKAHKADHILAGALINGRACAKAASELSRDLVILCAGTQDAFSLEDGLCAGQIVEEFVQSAGSTALEINDLGLAMLGSYRSASSNLEEAMLRCSNGRRLSKLGFRQDITYCAQLNQTELVPILHAAGMVPYRH